MIKVNEAINPNEFLELVKKAETEGERIIIEKEGKGKVAILNYADFEELEALEDARDCEELRQAMEESKSHGKFYTLEEVLAERGLTIEDIMSESDE